MGVRRAAARPRLILYTNYIGVTPLLR
jgi:hypothetical protein